MDIDGATGVMEEAKEESSVKPTRGAHEGNVLTESEPSTQPLIDVRGPRELERDDETVPSGLHGQPSHEDVTRLEKEHEQMKQVLSIIYDQLPQNVRDKIQGPRRTQFLRGSENTGISGHVLSEKRLQRLAAWLKEKKPFEDLKESVLGMVVTCILSLC